MESARLEKGRGESRVQREKKNKGSQEPGTEGMWKRGSKEQERKAERAV